MSQTTCGVIIELSDDEGSTFTPYCQDFYGHEGPHFAALTWVDSQ